METNKAIQAIGVLEIIKHEIDQEIKFLNDIIINEYSVCQKVRLQISIDFRHLMSRIIFARELLIGLIGGK
jgi:hypothetical protein